MEDTEYEAYLKKQTCEDLLSIRNSINRVANHARFALVNVEIESRERMPVPPPLSGLSPDPMLRPHTQPEEVSSPTSNTEYDSACHTPSMTELNHRIISGFWVRLLALMVDGLCLGLTGLVLGLLLFDSLARLGGWGRLLGFFIALVYFGVLNSAMGKGQTIGKRIMKIEVIDRSGKHLSIGRSFLRYAVLGIPFFLNGALISPSVMISPIGYVIGFILFGAGGAIIYLYICNRLTRQSLHDLFVGSFVAKTTPNDNLRVRHWNCSVLENPELSA